MHAARIVALVLCVAASGCATQSQSVSDVFIGNWQGSFIQFGAPRPHGIEINIRRGDDQRLRAITLYPESGCVGELAIKTAQPQTIKFTETLTPQQRCGPPRELSLIWAQEGRVMVVMPRPPAQGTLVRADTSPAMSSTVSRSAGGPSPGSSKATTAASLRPEIGELAQAVDSGFLRWSQVWPADRYLPGSPRITQVLQQGPLTVVRGSFAVVRQGTPVSVPYAAELKSGGRQFTLAGLCKQERSNAAADCYDAERVAQQLRQEALKGAVLLGLVAVIVDAAGDPVPLQCEWLSRPANPSEANAVDNAGNPIHKWEHCVPEK